MALNEMTLKRESVSHQTASISALVRGYVDQGVVPCAMTAIVQSGKIIHAEAYGYADLETGKKISADTLFRLYSMTKPIATVAAMILYEKGELSLDRELAFYLPEFKQMNVYRRGRLEPANRQITIWNLLTHTAGLTYINEIDDPAIAQYYKHISHEDLDRLSGLTLAEHVRNLASAPLIAQPGTEWHYSEAITVLSRVVEVVSGQPFATFLQKEILDPLGMQDTDFAVPTHKAHRLAGLYVSEGSEGLKRADEKGYGGSYLREPSLICGGTGLVSTAEDYMRFCQMLLNKGELDGVRILKPETAQLMMANQLGKEFGSTPLSSLGHSFLARGGLGQGFGGMLVIDPELAGVPGGCGQYSWGGWANTEFWIDPEKQVIGLVLTQVILKSGQLNLGLEIREQVYQALNM